MSDLTREALIEAVAERISWDGGDFTRWMPDAHPDHNRWSWRGDGHGEAMRAVYRVQAEAALDVVLAALRPVMFGATTAEQTSAVVAAESEGA